MRQLGALFALLLFVASAGATVQIIVGAHPNTAQSNSATNYNSVPLHGYSTTENTVESMISAPGAMAGLKVVLASAPGSTKSWLFTIRKNEVDTALTCTVSDPNSSCVDNTNVVTFVAGDRVSISSVPTGTPTSANARVTVLWQPTNTDETIWPSTSGGGTLNTATGFMMPLASGSPATQSQGELLVPVAGTVKSLYAWFSANAAASSSRILTVQKGAGTTAPTDTTMTCTVAAGAATCNDTNAAHNISVSAGDTITIKYTSTGTPGAAGAAVGVLFVPSTTTQFAWGFNTLSGTFPNGATDEFARVNGLNGISTTEGEFTQSAVHACTVKTMQFQEPLGANGGTLAITLRNSVGGNTALTCSSVGAQTCSATTDVTVAESDILDTIAHHTGTAGTARTGMVSYGVVTSVTFPTTTTSSSTTTTTTSTTTTTTTTTTSTTTPQTTAAQGVPVFFGGCETGTTATTKWEVPSDIIVSASGTAQCESTYAHTGSYGFSVGNIASGPTSSAAYFSYTFVGGATYSTLYHRIWVNAANHCASGANQNKICTTDDTNASTGCGAGATCPNCCVAAISGGASEPFYSLGHSATQDYELRLVTAFTAAQVSLYTGTTLIYSLPTWGGTLSSMNSWHSIGLKIDTSPSGNDLYELWQDGTLIASNNTGAAMAANIDQIWIGRGTNRNSGSALFYLDDWWQSQNGYGGWAGGTIARQGTGAIGPTDNDFSCSTCTCATVPGGTCAPSCSANTACCNLSQSPEESVTNKCSGTGNNQAQAQAIALAKFSTSQSGHSGTVGANDVINGFRATCSVSMGSDGAAGVYTRLRDNNLNLIANNPFSGTDFNTNPRPIGECCYQLGSQVLDFMQYGIATNTGKTVTIGDCWGMMDYTPAQAAAAGNLVYSE